MREVDCEVALARGDEAAECPEIERRAATLFSPEDLPPAFAAESTPTSVYARAQREERLIVARRGDGQVLGFALLRVFDEECRTHLEEIDVDPDFGRRGIGRRLVDACCGWARARGCGEISLSTFRDVPWNAPFYARMGFEILDEAEWSPALRRIGEHEREEGFDARRRVMMRRSIGPEDGRANPSSADSGTAAHPAEGWDGP